MEANNDNPHFDQVFNQSKTLLTSNFQYLDDIFLLNVTNPQLATNQHFLRLKEWMFKYHKELHERQNYEKDKYEQQDPLRITLYQTLRRLLREIALTKDPNTQLKYLQQICKWISKKEQRPLQVSNKHGIRHNIVKEQVQLTKDLYKDREQILHPEISLPKERIIGFYRRTLKKDEERCITPKKKVKLVDELKESPITKPQRSKSTTRNYVRSIPIEARSTYLYYVPKDDKEQEVERVWFANKNKKIMKKRAIAESLNNLKKWGYAKARLNEAITRKIENDINSNNFSVRNYQSKRLQRLKSTNRAHKRYKELYDEESEDEGSKSPIKRFYEPPTVTKLSEDIPKTKERLKRSILPDVTKAIYDGDKSRVDYIRRMYGHYINTANENINSTDSIFISGPKGINTLSAYNKDVRRNYTEFDLRKEVTRSIPIAHLGSRDLFRIQQVKEINRMKKHLAKEEIPCTMMSLQRAVLVPEDHSTNDISMKNFPRAESRLFINPFEIKKRAKKKKKK